VKEQTEAARLADALERGGYDAQMAKIMDKAAAELLRLSPMEQELERVKADRDSWMQQASDRVAGALTFSKEADRLEAEVQALRGAVPAAIEATADNDAAYGYQDGWNACRKAMLAAAPQPAAQRSGCTARTDEECTQPTEPAAIVKWQVGGKVVHLLADVAEGSLLYTRPAVGLTDEQKRQGYKAAGEQYQGMGLMEFFLEGVSFAEREHKIGGAE
jgi:hypothetical protein